MRFFWMVTLGTLMACGPRPDLRMCPVQLPPDAVQLGVQGLQSTVVLQGPTVACADRGVTVTLEVIDPDGTLVPTLVPPLSTDTAANESFDVTENVSVRVPLTPDKPGRWSINASWSTGGSTVLTFVVAKAIAAGPSVLRRFIDRMDNCVRGPFRTNSGLTACQRNDGEIWTYSSDGQVQEHFSGAQLAVRGDEIWSWKATGELEHRTALLGALRFDGAVPLLGGWAEGATLPNLAVRAESDRIQEISWNGATLTVRTITGGYAFSDWVVIVQGTQTWSGTGCLVERGCSQALCEPVRTCTIPTGRVLAIDAQAIWSLGAVEGGVGRTVLNLVVNPLPLSIQPVERPAPRLLLPRDAADFAFLPDPTAPMLELPRVLRLKDSILIPRLSADQKVEFLGVATPGNPLTMTADWIVSQGSDVFTLLATPMPSLQ